MGLATLVAGAAAFSGLAALGSGDLHRSSPALRQAAAATLPRDFGKLPLAFEPNAGRTDRRVRFIARGPGYALFLTRRESVLELGPGEVVRTRLVGATPATIAGERPLPGVVNSYVGGRSVAGVRSFGQVRYGSVYPRTDLVYYGRQGRLEYDFILRPGADPARPAFAITGARSLRLDAQGNLRIRTKAGVLRQLRPVAYQQIGRERKHVAVGFRVHDRRVQLSVGRYDHSRPLVIDPKLVYSSYFGGNASEYGWGLTADSSGSVYMVGATLSTDFPTTGQQLPFHSGSFGDRDVFLTRFTADGKTRVFSTYFGGGAEDVGEAIALDGAGGVYIAGNTASTNLFKTDGSAHQVPSGSTATSAFYASFDSDGNIRYSGELGGTAFTGTPSFSQNDSTFGLGIAADSSGNAYLTGSTNTSNLKVDYVDAGKTDVAANNTLGDSTADGFVARITPNANSNDSGNPTVSWVHYLAGNSLDEGFGITAAGNGMAYVVGRTYSNNFPFVSGARAADYDAFVVKTDGTTGGTTGAYIGGSGDQEAHSVVTDASGNVYVDGWAKSEITTPSNDTGVSNPTFPGNGSLAQGFVTKLNSSLARLSTTYLGGTSGTYGTTLNQIALDALGNVYVAGTTDSTTIPLVNPVQSVDKGFGDILIAKLNAAGSTVFSTYLGGATNQEEGWGIATVPDGGVVVGGWSFSSDFPTTADAKQPTLDGVSDAILVKLQPAPAQIDSGPVGPVANASPSFGFSAADSGDTFKCSLDGANPPATSCSSTVAFAGLAQGAHTFRVLAFDSGGSTDGTVAARQFFVDTVAPGAPSLQQPGDAESVLTLSPALQWSTASDPNPASGVDHYQLLIDGKPDQTVASSACSGGACSTTPSAPLAEGTHTWKVVAVDAAGNSTGSSSRTFTAATPITPNLAISPNPALVGREVTFDGSGTDAHGGTIAKYEWDLDGDGSFETDTGTAPKTTRTYAAPTTLDVKMRVTSVTGQSALADAALVVTDTTPSGQFGVSINNGAQYTRSPEVTVTTTFPSSIRSLIFSNDGGFFAPTTFAAQRETKWKLDSSGPERLPKIVYVRFMSGPLVVQTLTDDIILDETPPTVDQATVTPAAAPSAARAAKLPRWKVKVRARDANSGVDKLQVSADKRRPGRLLPYQAKLTVKSAKRPRWVRARDRAGNFSRWRKAH